MNFLDNFVLPQSLEHIELLHYILMLVLFLFIPFMAVLFGGGTLSVYFRRRGANEGNPVFLKFSKDLIELVTINKSIGIIIGIVPILTSVIIFAQLLHTTGAYSVTYLLFSFLFAVIGIILIYTYRYSVSFNDMFESLNAINPENTEVKEELNKYREGSRTLSSSSGIYGVILLFIALYLFTSGQTIVIYILGYGDMGLFSIFSWITMIRFLELLSASAALTGVSILFAFFYWDGGKKVTDQKYLELIKKTGLYLAFTGGLLLPVLITVGILALPNYSVSGAVFTYGIIGILLLFIGYHFLYAMIKNADYKYSGALFFIFLFAMVSFIIKDQMAMSNATKPHSAVLALNYAVYLKELKGEDATAEQVSGEEIFKNICASCHAFDHKVVGPPYNETLPKYEGKMNQLVAFIRNPSKIDPNFPPMPNPGIKPNAAQAVAEYIMKTYKK